MYSSGCSGCESINKIIPDFLSGTNGLYLSPSMYWMNFLCFSRTLEGFVRTCEFGSWSCFFSGTFCSSISICWVGLEASWVYAALLLFLRECSPSTLLLVLLMISNLVEGCLESDLLSLAWERDGSPSLFFFLVLLVTLSCIESLAASWSPSSFLSSLVSIGGYWKRDGLALH